jgi:hypothetical protein
MSSYMSDIRSRHLMFGIAILPTPIILTAIGESHEENHNPRYRT